MLSDLILDFAPNLFFQTGFAILEGGCTTLKNEVCGLSDESDHDDPVLTSAR